MSILGAVMLEIMQLQQASLQTQLAPVYAQQLKHHTLLCSHVQIFCNQNADTCNANINVLQAANIRSGNMTIHYVCSTHTNSMQGKFFLVVLLTLLISLQC